MHTKQTRLLVVIALFLLVGVGLIAAFTKLPLFQKTPSVAPIVPTANTETQLPPAPKQTHIPMPNPVKAIYMTSWVGSVKPWREQLVSFINTSEINAVVIDVKDYSGTLSFDTQDPELQAYQEVRIKDLRDFIKHLHDNHIYVIARITVFQDPTYAKMHPNLAVQSVAFGQPWKDKHGLSYIDPSAKPFWEHIVRIAKASEAAGFDELNFDYIRFPTDGNMKDMAFPLTGAITKPQIVEVLASSNTTSESTTASLSATQKVFRSKKQQALKHFFAYLHEELKDLGVPISADLFGMVLTSRDDLNIGQVLETAAPYFDVICPMIYPSHYPPGFNQFANPADHPYEIVKAVLNSGGARLEAAGYPRTKLRPWLQDFNLGATYDAQKIRLQKQACKDAGIASWLFWDPRNKYTRGGYDQ
ncbi:MAG: putative glycoside hydrolase [Candidatus Margulisiibacteriota bacterium]